MAQPTRPKSHSTSGASVPQRIPASVVSVITGKFLLYAPSTRPSRPSICTEFRQLPSSISRTAGYVM